jgi:hypothetical protein
MSRHLCHAMGCPTEIAPRLLMCAHHWRMVPASLRESIWKEYRPGQEIDKQPSEAYVTYPRP